VCALFTVGCNVLQSWGLPWSKKSGQMLTNFEHSTCHHRPVFLSFWKTLRRIQTPWLVNTWNLCVLFGHCNTLQHSAILCRRCNTHFTHTAEMQNNLCKCLLTFCHNLFVRKDKTKYHKWWHGGKLHQTMVDSWYSPDRFVAEGISQVSRRSEVGNTKRRSLITRLSSGTSAGTFALSAGPYRNYHSKAGTKNEP